MDDLIYNQRKIPKEKWRYGFRSSAAVGCGWIATYNALLFLGRKVDINGLIRSYERQLPLINGNTGTFVLGPALLLRHMGYDVTMTAKKAEMDRVCRDSDVGILFYYWRSGLRIGSHFVAVRHTEDGFVGYNTFINSTGPDSYGPSLEAFLKKHGYFGAVLAGVKRRGGNQPPAQNAL